MVKSKPVNKICIKLKKSISGKLPRHVATAKSLGLRKTNSSRVHVATPDILGKVQQISYLIEVIEVA